MTKDTKEQIDKIFDKYYYSLEGGKPIDLEGWKEELSTLYTEMVEGELQKNKEKYIDLLTQELRWHQHADNKEMGVTDEQKLWFIEGIIQSIYLIMGRSGKKTFTEFKQYLLERSKE